MLGIQSKEVNDSFFGFFIRKYPIPRYMDIYI
jgi:hypothetical protein